MVEPGIIIMAKALGSGMPLSAIVARKDIMEAWEAPAHFFTTGANPLCCAAALAGIEVIEQENLLEKASRMGEYLKKHFEEMQEDHELIGDIRGKGLLLGVNLIKNRETKRAAREEALKVCWRCWETGLILMTLGKSILRIAPPLNLMREEADQALRIIEEAIIDTEKGAIPDTVLEKMQGW